MYNENNAGIDDIPLEPFMFPVGMLREDVVWQDEQNSTNPPKVLKINNPNK